MTPDEDDSEVIGSDVILNSGSKKKNKKKNEASAVNDSNVEDDPTEGIDERKAGSGGILHQGDNELKPKRPLNAYHLYAGDVRGNVKASNPDLNGNEIAKRIIADYKALGDSERQRYRNKAAEAQSDFKEKYGQDAMKLGPRTKGKDAKKNQNVAATSVKSGGGGDGDSHSNGKQVTNADASNAAVNDMKKSKKRKNVAVEKHDDYDEDASENEEDEMPEAWAD